MSSHQLTVEVREETGRRGNRKLRAGGKIPAVIYGLGEDNVSLSVPVDELNRLISQGERIVSLAGGVNGDAFIRDVQWDLYGTQPIHVDFTRVKAGQMLETTVALELRGEAPGTKVGGQLEQILREMPIKCPPRSMTDKLEVLVNELEMDGKITVGELALPEGAEAVLEADAVVVQCVEKKEVPEEDESEVPAITAAEPEVIGEKKDDSDDS